MTNFAVYIVGERLILPTKARTSVGLWMEIEPVAVAEVSDPNAIVAVIAAALAAPHPSVAMPPKHDLPKPVVLGPAGVKTWRAFHDKAHGWTIEKKSAAYHVTPLVRDDEGPGFIFDQEYKIELPLRDRLQDTAVDIARVIAKTL